MDRRIDIAVALAVVALGAFILVATQQIGDSPIPDPIGPRGIPTGLSIVLMVGGGALAVRRLASWRRDDTLVEPEGTEDDAGVPPGRALRAMALWVCAFGYVLVLPAVGYLIATPVFVAAALVLLRFDRPRLFGVPGIVLMPILFSATTYLIFATLLGLRLPVGFLRDIFPGLG